MQGPAGENMGPGVLKEAFPLKKPQPYPCCPLFASTPAQDYACPAEWLSWLLPSTGDPPAPPSLPPLYPPPFRIPPSLPNPALFSSSSSVHRLIFSVSNSPSLPSSLPPSLLPARTTSALLNFGVTTVLADYAATLMYAWKFFTLYPARRRATNLSEFLVWWQRAWRQERKMRARQKKQR